ncbi:hypothetical protein TRVL_07346 [Trypanosoma vivax]|nr:hypothetical protein TRVL_07346 [Trypanosoma vivax]
MCSCAASLSGQKWVLVCTVNNAAGEVRCLCLALTSFIFLFFCRALQLTAYQYSTHNDFPTTYSCLQVPGNSWTAVPNSAVVINVTALPRTSSLFELESGIEEIEAALASVGNMPSSWRPEHEATWPF